MRNHVGIFEPTNTNFDPPGTCLFDPPESEAAQLGAEAARLKRDPKRPEIILRPQPSNSGLDPLNFARWRKEAMFFVLIVASVLTGVIGPILVPAFGTVAQDLQQPVAKIAQLNGILVLFEGVATMVIVVTAQFFGRRHTYVACSILSFVGCCWGAVAKDYNSIYGARILMGAGMASAAVMLGSTITDTFFVHQHGVRIAWWQVSYCASVNLAPILSGVIATNHGWRACFWVLAAFEGLVLVGIFFLCPETMYDRPASAVDPLEVDKYTTEHLEHKEKDGVATSSASAIEAQQDGPVVDTLSFWTSLKLWSHFKPRDSLYVVVLRPFAVLLSPHIFWANLAYTISFAWFVMTGATYGQMYEGMYYQESVSTVGVLAGVAPMIGTILACLISGPLTDWSARWLSVRNHGIFEPEYRLVVLIPAFITTAIGGFGWAWTVGPGWNVLVSTSIAGFVFCGCTLGICSVVGYANACYPKQGGDTFSIMMLASRAAIFGMTYVVNNWLALYGVENFLGIMTGVTLGLYLLGLPIYCYGKRIRSWTAQSKVLGWCCS